MNDNQRTCQHHFGCHPSPMIFWPAVLMVLLGMAGLLLAQNDPSAVAASDPEAARWQARFYWVVLTLILTTFFMLVALITLIRMRRRFLASKGIGQRGDKTQYVDVWGQCRVSQEELDNFDPDVQSFLNENDDDLDDEDDDDKNQPWRGL